MLTSETATERPICPYCGHENIPGAMFCAQCGRSLSGDEPAPAVVDNSDETDMTVAGDGDTQTTSVFEPVAPSDTVATTSPWAPPGSIEAAPTDPGQTSALPVSEPYSWDRQEAASIAPVPTGTHRESPRGFVLGLIAMVIIAAVLLLYWYWAWIGDSTRDSIEGWIPWVS